MILNGWMSGRMLWADQATKPPSIVKGLTRGARLGPYEIQPKGLLPIDDAFRYGTQIAEALDEAHRTRFIC